MMFSDLLDRRILVVEDDYMQASELSVALELQGSNVVGPFPVPEEGLEAIEHAEVDAAVLDVHLGEQRVYHLADVLNERKIPFLFVTGYDPTEIPDRFAGIHCLQKPFDMDGLAVILAIALAGRRKPLH